MTYIDISGKGASGEGRTDPSLISYVGNKTPEETQTVELVDCLVYHGSEIDWEASDKEYKQALKTAFNAGKLEGYKEKERI